MIATFLDKIYDVVAPRRDLKRGDVVKTNKNSRMINYAMEKNSFEGGNGGKTGMAKDNGNESA